MTKKLLEKLIRKALSQGKNPDYLVTAWFIQEQRERQRKKL